MTTPLSKRSDRLALYLIFFTWALNEAFAFWHFGFSTSIDTATYIIDARSILSGEWPTGQNLWYSGYSFILAAIIFITGNAKTIVVIQIVCSGLAVWCLYKLIEDLAKSRTVAIIATIPYALWPEIHQWNMFIYTDALFTGMVVISVSAIHFSSTTRGYVFSAILCMLTIFIRPIGLLFLAALAMSYLLTSAFENRGTIVRVTTTIVSLLIGIIVINWVLADYIDSFISSYSNTEIIYPGIALGMSRPSDLTIPEAGDQPVFRFLMFMVTNPMYFFKISVVKAALFLGHIKPYYSLFHNIAISVVLFPIYLFAALGVKAFPKGFIKTWVILFVAAQVLVVSLTSENWDGRFLLPLLPWMFGLMAFGVRSVFPGVMRSGI